MTRMNWAVEKLEKAKADGLFRELRTLEHLKGTSATLKGREVTLFCGNDYLGLSQHPRLKAAAHETIDSWGVGAGSARLIAGTSKFHSALEVRIAQFLGKQRTLVFSSGYLANLGALTALTESGDLILLDKLCHASLIDAAHMSSAVVRVYPHRNLKYLERLLKQSKAKRTWIVTDSIFSMDGDLAPLVELVTLKQRYGSYLVIDEAHATGVFGANGRGVSEHLGVLEKVDVHIGTCSKAVGALGGFVAGANELIELLINRARTFIFDTALPPSICAASIAAFDLIQEEPELRKKLWRNVERLKAGFENLNLRVPNVCSPIIPIVIGDEKKALQQAQALLEEGFLVPAVRYPTVPRGKARLRLTVSSAHSESDLDRLLEAFGRIANAPRTEALFV